MNVDRTCAVKSPYCVLILVYKDKNTPQPFVEDLQQYGDSGESQKAAKQDHIYMDCMGFGK